MPVICKPNLTCRAESDDVWNGRRAGTTALLLSASNDQRRQGNSATNVERADALRRVQLVTGKRKQIDSSVFEIDRDFTHCLYTVNVENSVGVFAHNTADDVDGKKHSGLVVCQHRRT